MLFGNAGFNCALSSAYILFELLEANQPNTVRNGGQLDHYLWAYFLATLAGGIIGGILHKLHVKFNEDSDGDAADGDDGAFE